MGLAMAVWRQVFTCLLYILLDFASPTTFPANCDDDANPFTTDEVSQEKRLMNDVFRRYRRLGRDGRPVRNSSVPVRVEFGLGLIKMELYERENMLSLSTWARYRWRDEYLTWEPADYDDTRSVKVPPDRIWIPDIMLYNTANTEESERKVMAVIGYDGMVTWYPHKVFQSSCAIDVRHFPFDNQTCHMWFGSWTHTVQEVDVRLAFPAGIDLSTFKSVYKEVSEWDIYNISAERIIVPPDQANSYAILSFTLFLRRKLMFSTYILTMPAIFLAFLTLLVFWLPPEHSDKSALGLTIFGSLLLLLLILVEAAPPTASAVPLLGIYYCFTTVIVILSIFLSSLVVKIGRTCESSNRKRVPRCLRVIILDGLGRVLCMPYTPYACHGRPCHDRKSRKYAEGDDVLEKEPLSRYPEETSKISGDPQDDGKFNGTVGTLSSIDKRIRSLTEIITNVIISRNASDAQEILAKDIEREWRHLAMVLDRLFFFCYLIIIVISLVIFFPRRSSG